MGTLQDMNHFGQLVVGGAHHIGKILAGKTHFKYVLLLEVKLVLDIFYYIGSGRSRKSKDWYTGLHISYFCNFEIRWAEIVTPLADAVSFIYRDETHRNVAQFSLEQF